MISRSYAANSGGANRWDAWDRASTTPPAKHSSLPSNTRCSPGPLHDQNASPRGHHHLVLRVLQHPTSAQRSRIATTHRIREDHSHPTGGRIKESFTFSGEAQCAAWVFVLAAPGWVVDGVVLSGTAT